MPKQSVIWQYIKSPKGRFSFVLVLACASGLAWLIGRTFFDPLPKTYSLDFGGARWIEASKASQTTYFRKTLFVSGSVSRAWVQIAATDDYSLYVNDVRVAQRHFYGISVAGLYDVKKALRAGKNVIAVHVDRRSYPGQAQLLVRGFYSEVGSPLREFWSDPTWKASTTPDGIVGGYSWRAPELEDSFWQNADEASASNRFSPIESVSFAPQILETRPTAEWIASQESSATEVSFRYTLDAPLHRHETWLQIAATGSYDLLLNGRLVASQVATAHPVLLAYDVSRWLSGGSNSLLIHVSSQIAPAMLLCEGYTVRADGTLQRFSSNGNWYTLLYAGMNKPAAVMARYGDRPFGDLLQALADPAVISTFDLYTILRWFLIIATVATALLFLWVLVPSLCSHLNGYPAEKLWNYDALFHLCVLSLILALWLLSFDVRFQNDWCFKPKFVLGAALLLFAGKLSLMFPPKNRTSTLSRAPHRGLPWLHGRWQIITLIFIVLLGFGLRVHNLTTVSLDVDEMGVIQFSSGVFKKGYPFIQLGSFEKQVTTYELVSYSLAASRLLFGDTEAAFRLPSLICGTLTIGILGVMGYRMMGWRVGLLAAVTFALLPSAIYWSRNAFWPAQELMLALFTIWCFYEAVRSGPLRHGFLTASTIGFILAYLTWEGSGFLVPAMFACMFAMRWGRPSWIRDWHLWRCFGIMTFVVIIQLTHRQVASLPMYLQVGVSLSDVSTPEIVYLNPTLYNPLYYFIHFLFAENYCVMTLVTVLGMAFCWRDRAIRYTLISLLVLFACYVELLPAYGVRYSFTCQALLVLASVGIMFRLWDKITHFGDFKLKLFAATALLGLFCLAANDFVLKTYRLCWDPSDPQVSERRGIYRVDYRAAAQFVAAQIEPGDGLVVTIPHIFEYYANRKPDYSMNTMMNKKMTYSGALDVPHFIDKWKGLPSVLNLEELQDLRSRYKRLWIVQAPGGAATQTPEVRQYLQENAKVSFESYSAEVDVLQGTTSNNEKG
jgi:hypothetical protein